MVKIPSCGCGRLLIQVFCIGSGRSMNPDQLREDLQEVPRDELRVHLEPGADGLHLSGHTSGSLVFNRAGNVKEAQTWLGHSSSRTTMDTFVHSVRESQHAAADVVSVAPLCQLWRRSTKLKAFALRLVPNFGTD
jgi:hypothetical protein